MYEYQSGVIPSLPPDYDSSNTDLNTDTKQILKNQDKLIEFYYYQLNTEKEQNVLYQDKIDTLISQNKTLTDSLSSVASNGSTSVTSVQADKIIDGLHQTNAILAYSFALIGVWFLIRKIYQFFGGVLFGGI